MVEQGDIIMAENIKFPCVVVSNNFYNKCNRVVVCPVVREDESNMSYKIAINGKTNYVRCDDVRRMDLSARFFSVKGRLGVADLLNILNIVNSLFDFL